MSIFGYPERGGNSTSYYILAVEDENLPNGLVLTAGSNIVIVTDTNAGTITISAAGSDIDDEPYLTYSPSAALSAERVLTAGVDVNFDTSVSGQLIINAQATGGGGASTSASYITAATETGLSGERVLTGGQFISVTDGGANSTITVGVDPTLLGMSFLTVGAETGLTAERRLAVGGGLFIQDSGGNGTLTISGSGYSTTSEPYVTIGNSSNLSSERALTGTRGVVLTDGGAGGSATLTNGGVTSTSSASYSVASGDFIILFDSSGGNKVCTLPDPTAFSGRVLYIKKFDTSSNTVTINKNSSETIDGSASYVLSASYQGVAMASDGTNWAIF